MLEKGLNSHARWCVSHPTGKYFVFILPKSFCYRKTFVFKPYGFSSRKNTKIATLMDCDFKMVLEKGLEPLRQ